MEDVDFSDEFCRFVQMHVPNVDQAERLLAEYRSPDAARSPEWARFQAAARAAGLIEGQAERHLATLAQAYDTRPVTLVRLIYALRDRSIQSFADAFRLRRR
jgi:hypothetical protein